MAAFPHYYFRHCEEQSDEATQFFFWLINWFASLIARNDG